MGGGRFGQGGWPAVGLGFVVDSALLFSDNPHQGVGHCLELLLVCCVLVTYGLDQEVLDPMVVAGFLGEGLMYRGDDFP